MNDTFEMIAEIRAYAASCSLSSSAPSARLSLRTEMDKDMIFGTMGIIASLTQSSIEARHNSVTVCNEGFSEVIADDVLSTLAVWTMAVVSRRP